MLYIEFDSLILHCNSCNEILTLQNRYFNITRVLENRIDPNGTLIPPWIYQKNLFCIEEAICPFCVEEIYEKRYRDVKIKT